MEEISVILKNNISITIEEFRILDRYSVTGNLWTLIRRPNPESPAVVYQRTTEYIFDPETLCIFNIISTNILATWNTSLTRNFGPNDELHLKDYFYIRPYRPATPLTLPNL